MDVFPDMFAVTTMGCFRSCLVLLTLAAPVGCGKCEGATVAPLQKKALKRPALPTIPSFEEEHTSTMAGRYHWRNRAIAADLSSSGNVTLRTSAGASVNLTFPGANPLSQPLGEILRRRKTLYFLGAQSNWRTNRHFAQIRYPQIYPGIDLVFHSAAGHLEYDFEVAPNADVKSIRIRYEGARISLSGAGDLKITLAGVQFVQRRPRAIGTNGAQVRCTYVLSSRQEVTLDLGKYDHSSKLLIDPTLTFSSYVGGSGFDAIYGLTADSSGNLYLVGETSSASLWSNTSLGRSSRDAFIVKLNSTASEILYTVYLGGGGNDSGRGIAMDSGGNLYVAGLTASTDFPTTTGAFSESLSGQEGAFVAKLNPAGNLLYSTYLGGVTSGSSIGIAVDNSSEAYVAGQTGSPSFPVTSGAIQGTYGGGASDCFVTKLNAAGSALVYSTFLGGSGLDACTGIALDSASYAYVSGMTYSANFPVLNPLQALNGTANAFVSKMNPSGTTLVYSTYIGGSNIDEATAIAVDSSGSAYITGASSSIDFPVTPGVLQTSLKGAYNAFASKLAPAGTSLLFSTFIGGSGSDTATSVAVARLGTVVIGGFTSSPDFPVVGGVQSVLEGAFDAFMITLDSQASQPLFSSYFGGSGDDRAYAAAIVGNNAYLAGSTASSNFPTMAAIQPYLNSGYDAFLLDVSAAASSPLLSIGKTHSGDFTQGQQNASYTVTVSNAANSPPTSGLVTVVETLPSGLKLISMSGSGWTCSEGVCTRSDGLAGGATYPNINVVVQVTANASSPQVNVVSVSGGGSSTASAEDSTEIVVPAVSGPSNLALDQQATQSSTLFPGVTDASKAVDGNTDGNYYDHSVTHSNADPNAWWQVDLGAVATIGSIVVWNRTDCCAGRLGDYWVFVSNTPFAATDTPTTLQNHAGTWSSHQTAQPNPNTTVTVPAVQGRYVRVQLSGTNYLSLAEVQVYGLPDLALNKPATQSSTLVLGTTDASKAVDGSVDGNYYHHSITHSNDDANAWWQVDLGAPVSISSILIWNRTDCCGSRLSDYWVFVSNTPFAVTDTPTTLQSRAGTWANHQTVQPNPNTPMPVPGVLGRYVRVQLSGKNYLSLAEVQVYGFLDLAVNRPATQSSTLVPGTTDASKAVDGNNDGNYYDYSVTHTNADVNAWWQVDLGAAATIGSIVIWNRTDCCEGRLNDYWVFVSNAPFASIDTPGTLQNRAGTWSSHQAVQPSPKTTITVPAVGGRYVRVQLSGTNYLSLAEVQVYGP